MIAAVVPVKTLASAKSRLLPHLGAKAVERLSVAMLRDVLAALRAVPSLDRVAVVTPDDDVADVARECGAEVVLITEPGLNPSIERAVAQLAPAPDDAALVVLGDVAGALAEDIEILLEALDGLDGSAVALAPSSDGGTSALLRRPKDAIAAGFGPQSASVHRERSARAGVAFREVALPSLALDIDEPEDLEKFLNSAAAGVHTRTLLRELAPSPS